MLLLIKEYLNKRKRKIFLNNNYFFNYYYYLLLLLLLLHIQQFKLYAGLVDNASAFKNLLGCANTLLIVVMLSPAGLNIGQKEGTKVLKFKFSRVYLPGY